MRSFFSRMMAGGLRHKGELLSVVAHLYLILCLFGGIRLSPKVAPLRLPGTAQGITPLTYYSPGSFRPLTSDTPLKSPVKAKSTPTLHPAPNAAKPETTQPAESEIGVGTSAKSGLGEGDITIALQTVFLYPAPDLSGLPHGTKGDVILDAVIDEHGKISELTLLKGLGPPVDDTVIAAVRQWQYTPAMKNGVPVVSEQELHFHYERG
jgi:periplasmic protein TonB